MLNSIAEQVVNDLSKELEPNEPGPSMSQDNSCSLFDSQSQPQSQSILMKNQTTVVQQTEDESDIDEAVADGENPPLISSAAPKTVYEPPPKRNSPAGAAGEGDGDEEEEDEEDDDDDNDGEPQEQANSMSSTFVEEEIRNCEHQINVASIALEQLRKVNYFTKKKITTKPIFSFICPNVVPFITG